MDAIFQKIARQTSDIAGTSVVFAGASIVVVIWLILGPLMHWSDTWQLIISSISSVVTFLMVFLIQYAQNKDTKALQLKLDELIRSNKEARKDLVDIEEEPEKRLTEEKIAIKQNTGKSK